MRDELHYLDPDKYNPDRFLENGKLRQEEWDPNNVVFGFGRRFVPFGPLGRIQIEQYSQNMSWSILCGSGNLADNCKCFSCLRHKACP